MRVKTWVSRLLAVVVVAGLPACKPIEIKGDPAAEAIARSTYEDIAAGRVTQIQARLTPEAAEVTTPAQILSLRPYADTAAPTARRLIGTNIFKDVKGPETQTLTYELVYRGHTVLYTATMKRSGPTGAWSVQSVNLNRATDAQLAKGRFTLNGRSPAQLLFLTATILSPLLMLSAVIAAFRAPGLKRKWLWALLSLTGVGAATMNWTTGETGFQPIMLNLIGSGVTKQGLSDFFPWIVKFTLPVGAVLTHWRAAKARKEASATQLEEAATTSSNGL